MHRMGAFVLVGSLAVFANLGACEFNPITGDIRSPADRARAIEPRCARTSRTVDAEALSPALVEGVDPSYGYVQSGNDRVPRLRGARIRVRPDATLSAELLQRSLECHQAHVTVGTAAPLADDPYAVAGAWLDIKAGSGGDGFVVAVETNDFDRAKEVLERARRFAASRP